MPNLVPPKEDTWAFQTIGSPFPDAPVKVIGQQNQYVALWYKNGKPIHGRAWNNNGVVECSFPYLKTELKGAHDLGGQIQILQYKGNHLNLGYWYNWIKYSDRFNIENREILHCGDSIPILWKSRPEGALLGYLDNKTEIARFSHDGICEEIVGPKLSDFLIVIREYKGAPPGCECKECGNKPPTIRVNSNVWRDYRIPFLEEYIRSVVREQPIADSSDWLNYYATSLMIAFFAFAISAKQYFGSPIQCWVPSEFKGGWEKYTEDYCFINNFYHVPFEQNIPEDLSEREDQISYYRWVPIVLFLQAACFFLPNWIWNALHKQTTINPKAIVNEARKARDFDGDEREQEMNILANHLCDNVFEFDHSAAIKVSTSKSGYNATALYLITKLLYVINAVGQLFMLNHFLGGDYLSWGFETLYDVAHGYQIRENDIFPRVIMCDFSVRVLGNIQRHSVQCVIMMNMINEKLYLFLYFWLVMMAVISSLSFLYYLTIMLFPSLRENNALYYLKKDSKRNGYFNDTQKMKRFVHKFLRPDGVLTLMFIRENVGDRIAYELVKKMFDIYKRRFAYYDTANSSRHHLLHHESGSNSTVSTNTPEKRIPLNIQSTQNNYDSYPEETYKSTPYSHARLLPNNHGPLKSQTSVFPVNYPNLPNIDDVDQHNIGTLRADDIINKENDPVSEPHSPLSQPFYSA
uniref:Innexin n=1 Tax=Parastrongyloides trichosuri TaxID=131310 RepID=A0A0N4ZZ03_PARTI